MASSRTTEEIRQAVVAGRVCVRDPRACSLRARTPKTAWQPLGAAFLNAPTIEVKARGEKIRVLVNGHLAVTPRSSEVAALPLDPNVCSIIRAEIDGGAGATIYANCAFASARPVWRQSSRKSAHVECRGRSSMTACEPLVSHVFPSPRQIAARQRHRRKSPRRGLINIGFSCRGAGSRNLGGSEHETQAGRDLGR